MNRSETFQVLGISGSLRANSFSTAIVNTLKKQSRPLMDIAVRTLEDIPPYNEDFDVEPAIPAVAALRKEVLASDGVIIATPEYNHGIPGVLKNALDWASRPAFESCFVDKPVLIISISQAFTGGVRAQYQLRETLVSMQAHVIPVREIAVAAVNTKMIQGAFSDEQSLSVVEAGLKTFRECILIRRGVSG